MADPKRGRDVDEKLLPRREDEGTRRETDRQGARKPSPHEKGDAGTGSGREVRPM
ncbi:MAG TPA: hypothetical protein VFH11_11265 [Gemmatimonadota bacterium]|nr:hypothetical protein [Gemmatimonadota bacterium]